MIARQSSHCEIPTYEIDEEKYRLVAIRHHAQRLVYNLTSHEITYKQLKTNTLNNFLQSNFFFLHLVTHANNTKNALISFLTFANPIPSQTETMTTLVW